MADDDAALLEDSAEDLYEHAPCGYLSSYPDGRIAKVNQTFLSWTGYAREELVGRAPVHRPAHRRRPDLPRDPLRAAAADAGLGAGDRDGPGARRRQPDAGARQLPAAHRRGRPAARRTHHDLRRQRPQGVRDRAARRPPAGRAGHRLGTGGRAGRRRARRGLRCRRGRRRSWPTPGTTAFAATASVLWMLDPATGELVWTAASGAVGELADLPPAQDSLPAGRPAPGRRGRRRSAPRTPGSFPRLRAALGAGRA